VRRYSNTPGVPGSIVVTLGLNAVELAVYERRTGKKLGAHVFPPMTKCPAIASSTAEGVGASNADMIAWLTARLAAGPVR
jgi:hypothetical protein